MRRPALALLSLMLVAGCGSSSPVRTRVFGRTLRIYVSVPLMGASSIQGRAVLRGAQLALADHGGRVGQYRVALSVRSDATLASHGWDPNQTTLNARAAALDPDAVGYLGDLGSGPTAVSIPVLNRAGIAQISPAAGAVGLTSAGPGASPGEPAKYYPTGIRTFARIAPSDAIESAAVVALELRLGCHAPFVLQDGEVDGEDAAISYVLSAQAAGLHVLGVQSFNRQAPSYASLAASLAQTRADCILLDSDDEHSAAVLAQQLGRSLPKVRILASSQLADSAFTEPGHGGIPLALDPRVLVVSPARPAAAYPRSGQAFLARYARLYGEPPPQAIFGYCAMSLMLSAISRATEDGRLAAERSKIVQALFGIRAWPSLLGELSVGRDGDSSLTRLGVYRILAGRLAFWRSIG